MNTISNELRTMIEEDQKRVNIIAELQDVVGLMNNEDQIRRIQKVIQELMI